jgi:hypothetical protein
LRSRRFISKTPAVGLQEVSNSPVESDFSDAAIAPHLAIKDPWLKEL